MEEKRVHVDLKCLDLRPLTSLSTEVALDKRCGLLAVLNTHLAGRSAHADQRKGLHGSLLPPFTFRSATDVIGLLQPYSRRDRASGQVF